MAILFTSKNQDVRLEFGVFFSPFDLLFHLLHFHQALVDAVFAKQRGMGATLGYPAFVKHYYFIGMLHSR